MITITELKQFISDHLYKKNGHLYPCPPDDWWTRNNYILIKDHIFNITSFLHNPCWPQRIWHINNEVFDIKYCSYDKCTNQLHWNPILSAYPEYCCKKCSGMSPSRKQKFMDTCLERYNVSAPAKSELIQNIRKQNTIEKYGTDHHFKLPDVSEKIKQTCLKKFGVSNPLLAPEIYEQTRKTNLERYGTINAIQNKDILNKRTITNITKYGGHSPTTDPMVKQKQQQALYDKYGVHNFKYVNIDDWVIELLKNEDKFVEFVSGKYIHDIVQSTSLDITTVYKYIQLYNCNDVILKNIGRSSHEIEVSNFLTEHDISFESNNRTILYPQELDFYLPQYNIAIELCGVYYHSEEFGKDKWYHYKKWEICKNKGITLLTYFDDEIINCFDIIKSKILYLTNKGNFTNIGARKVTIAPISIDEEKDFFLHNHIQGFVNNRNITIGAYHDDKLIAAMCITNRKDYKEITRFAVDISSHVPGIFSKFLKYYIHQYNITGKIVSFSNNCHSSGKLYETTGFTCVNIQPPNYYYSLNGRPRLNKQQFMKSKIIKKYPNVDISMTEHNMMLSLGYQRIWDCGKLKWEIIV